MRCGCLLRAAAPAAPTLLRRCAAPPLTSAAVRGLGRIATLSAGRRHCASLAAGSAGGVGPGADGEVWLDAEAVEAILDDDAVAPDVSADGAEAASLRQRRAVHEAAVRLKGLVEAELAAEVARDAADGAAAVPPLPPSGGWAVRHPAGSSFVVMSRTIPGHSRVADDERGLQQLDGDDGGAAEEPRYRSVHDTYLPPSASVRRDSRRRQQRDGPPLFPVAAAPHGERVPVVRSDVHVTVFIPFRSQDLSFHDPTVGIAEWLTFDVLVRKVPPEGLGTGSSSTEGHGGGGVAAEGGRPSEPRLLRGQQGVWDDRACMLVRLASADSELRIRSIQFLSAATARALETEAFFGHGDPVFVELLRQHLPIARQLHQQQQHGGGDLGGGAGPAATDPEELSAPQRRFLRGTRCSAHAQKSAAAAATLAGTAATGHHSTLTASSASSTAAAEALLTGVFTNTGEAARAQAYGGPYITDLSKELHDVLLSYLADDLGITGAVREYVCQVQYFMEQEEYVGWLARWRYLADRLHKNAPEL